MKISFLYDKKYLIERRRGVDLVLVGFVGNYLLGVILHCYKMWDGYQDRVNFWER